MIYVWKNQVLHAPRRSQIFSIVSRRRYAGHVISLHGSDYAVLHESKRVVSVRPRWRGANWQIVNSITSRSIESLVAQELNKRI